MISFISCIRGSGWPTHSNQIRAAVIEFLTTLLYKELTIQSKLIKSKPYQKESAITLSKYPSPSSKRYLYLVSIRFWPSSQCLKNKSQPLRPSQEKRTWALFLNFSSLLKNGVSKFELLKNGNTNGRKPFKKSKPDKINTNFNSKQFAIG